jgi:hypothetical protein
MDPGRGSAAGPFVFAWAINDTDPTPPGDGPYDCSLD